MGSQDRTSLYSNTKNADSLDNSPQKNRLDFYKKLWVTSQKWMVFTFLALLILSYFFGIIKSVTYTGYLDIISGVVVLLFGESFPDSTVAPGVNGFDYTHIATVLDDKETIFSDFIRPVIGFILGFILLAIS